MLIKLAYKGVCIYVLRICVIFLDKDVCEIVLILSDNTDHEFYLAIFIEEVFNMRCLLLLWDACIQTGDRIVKDWWQMVSTSDKKTDQ